MSSQSKAFSSNPIRIIILNEHPQHDTSLQKVFDKSAEFRCVGLFSDGEEALRRLGETRPEVALVDARIHGLDYLQRLKRKQPGLAIVLITTLADCRTAAQALSAGARGVLTRPFTVAQCLATLRFVVGRSGSEKLSLPKNIRLTARETEVMAGLAKGLLYKEIADELGISFSAVHKHQHKIFTKLGATNRTEAITKWHAQQRSP